MRDTSLDDFIGGDDGDDGDDETDDARETVGPVEGDGEGGSEHDDDVGEEGTTHETVGEEGTEHDAGDYEPAGGDEHDEGAAVAAAVQPAVSTSEWTPDGATCAECDVVVERRWRDGGELVCADCKEWSVTHD